MANPRQDSRGVDSRWMDCLQRHCPYHDEDLRDYLLTTVAYLVAGSPQIWTEPVTQTTDSLKETQTTESLKETQKQFKRCQGELASVVLLYDAWRSTPEPERSEWCRQYHVNSTSMERIGEEVLGLRQDIKGSARRRSLRSAKQVVKTAEGRDVGDHLALLLLQVFPECVYGRWHTTTTYLNCTTSNPHRVRTSEVDLYRLMDSKLPEFILCFPNTPSDSCEGKENVSSPAEVYVGLAISEAVVRDSGDGPLIERYPEVQQHMPVKVDLLDMGDALVLFFAGDEANRLKLRAEISEACSRKDILLVVDVHEPDDTYTGYALEIYCPAMYKKKVEYLMNQKITLTEKVMMCPADTIRFPDSQSKTRLLLESGGRIHAVPNGQHLALVHLITVHPDHRQVEQTRKLSEFLANTELLDSVIRSKLEIHGKVCQVERVGGYPDETLWGAVWFKYRSTALKAIDMAKDLVINGFLVMRLALVETEAPLFSLNFHWWKTHVLENRVELYFTQKEDLERFRDKEDEFDHLDFEYDTRRNMVTISSEDVDPISWQDMFDEHDKVRPKDVNYSHKVTYEGAGLSASELAAAFPACIERHFPDRDMIHATVEAPKPGASEIKGKISSYSATGLARAMKSLPDDWKVSGGEFSLSPTMHLNLAAPIEILRKVESRIKAFLRRNYDSPENGDDDDEDVFGMRAQPDGVMVGLTVVLQGRYDFSKLRPITSVLTPHTTHVRGDVLATLMAESGKDKEPNYVRIMKETDTYISVFKITSVVQIYGERDNVDAARTKIRNILAEFGPKTRQGEGTKKCRPLCVHNADCLRCGRENGEYMFRLSLCGHLYCHPCMRAMVEEAMNHARFPIVCLLCNDNVLFRDIEAILTYYGWPLSKLLTSSLQSLATENYVPCPTQGCAMRFHKPDSEDQGLVQCSTCPLCKATQCMACFTSPYHLGLNCTVSKALDTVDPQTIDWLDADPATRKLCPKCFKGIENRDPFCAFCRDCSVFICWECLECGSFQKISCHRCIREDAEW